MKLLFQYSSKDRWYWRAVNATKAYDSWMGFNATRAMTWLRENVR